MICVHQMMTREPFVLDGEVTVAEAVERILRQGVHGAVIVDAMFRPLGVVSVVDLARALLDPTERTRPVLDVASRPAITVQCDDGIYEAVRTMVRGGVHRLPVVGFDGVLKGVLSPMDVLRGIVNLEGAFRAEPRPPDDRL